MSDWEPASELSVRDLAMKLEGRSEALCDFAGLMPKFGDPRDAWRLKRWLEEELRAINVECAVLASELEGDLDAA